MMLGRVVFLRRVGVRGVSRTWATSTSKISRYEGMTDYMSLPQMQLIRDRLSRDSCGVGTVVSRETFFYMLKRVSADLGIHDDGLHKLITKIDANGDWKIQFSEYEAFVTAKEEAKGPTPLMAKSKICAIRERLREDSVGVGSEISADTFFMMIRYTSSDLGITDHEILDLIDHVDANGDRVIQKEEFNDFCNNLIGV